MYLQSGWGSHQTTLMMVAVMSCLCLLTAYIFTMRSDTGGHYQYMGRAQGQGEGMYSVDQLVIIGVANCAAKQFCKFVRSAVGVKAQVHILGWTGDCLWKQNLLSQKYELTAAFVQKIKQRTRGSPHPQNTQTAPAKPAFSFSQATDELSSAVSPDRSATEPLQPVSTNEDILVMITDTYDVLFQQPPEKILLAYESLGSPPALFSGEVCPPDPYEGEECHSRSGYCAHVVVPTVTDVPFRCLNTGGYICQSEKCMELWKQSKELGAQAGAGANDQKALILGLMRGEVKDVTVDHHLRVIMSMELGAEGRLARDKYFRFDPDKRVVTSRLTGSTPAVLHFASGCFNDRRKELSGPQLFENLWWQRGLPLWNGTEFQLLFERYVHFYDSQLRRVHVEIAKICTK